MALNLGRVQEYLSAESLWALGSQAPLWATTAIQSRMVPRLDGRLATAGLSDWQLLSLWSAWKGSRLQSGEEGQQLMADIESLWVDFREWLWREFGL